MTFFHSRASSRLAAITLLCIIIVGNVSVLTGIHVTSDSQLLADANARILKVRRGTIALDFGSGNASMPITIIQRSHTFRFGCEAFQFDMFSNNTQNEIYQMQIDKDSNKTLNDEYRSLFSALFNHATLPFFWTAVEWTRGV